MSEKEIREGLQRIDSYFVEKYKHRCPEEVHTMFNGYSYVFTPANGVRLVLATDCTTEYRAISQLSLTQLQGLAEALPRIEDNIVSAEVRRTLAITKTLDRIKKFESKQDGL